MYGVKVLDEHRLEKILTDCLREYKCISRMRINSLKFLPYTHRIACINALFENGFLEQKGSEYKTSIKGVAYLHDKLCGRMNSEEMSEYITKKSYCGKEKCWKENEIN